MRIVRSARAHIARYGEAPSFRELAAAVGLSSIATVSYHLRRLRELGVIVETRGRVSARCPHCGLTP
ncbi:winged helix-turn-helix transcriptional regulator [Streptomyces sp. MZ04]|nr:winged helix-turn-helix transcriptional regulator [Streptomyces sp. MZ04]